MTTRDRSDYTDCSDYIRSFIGKTVKVMRAPYSHRFGMIARVIDAHPDAPDSIACLADAKDIQCVITAATSGDWEFIAASGDPADATRMGVTYNEARFVSELDAVLTTVSQSLDELLPDALLSFRKGEDRGVALVKVIAVLMLRSQAPHARAVAFTEVLTSARQMLIEKNAAYGDSALNPVRVFASSSPMEQLLVRLDDKVSRIERGQAAGEDVANDLLGYLLLVLIAERRTETS